MYEFIMIPRSLIYNCELSEKRVLAYSSILFSGWDGKNIEELVKYSRFSTRRDSGSILYQYRELIYQFIKNQYFENKNSIIRCIRQSDCFGIIYYNEFQKILQARDDGIQNGRRINHSNVLLLLAHIRLCMIRQPNTPLFYSNLLNRISNSVGISVRNITKSLKVLEELNIIHNEELPRYKDSNGHWHSNVRIFVNMETEDCNYNWQEEVACGIRWIMSSQID